MFNLTIPVQNGTTTHGSQNLLCIPPSWTDYVIFYLANYFAHAATIINSPGQGLRETVGTIFLALLLPGSGILRALNAIYKHSIFAGDPIQQAICAGAFCMVVRKQNPNSPSNQHFPIRTDSWGDIWRNIQVMIITVVRDGRIRDILELHGNMNPHAASGGSRQDEAPIPSNSQRQWWQTPSPRYLPVDAKVYGEYRLPNNYELAFVPPFARIELVPPRKSSKEILVCEYNILKLLVSLLQALWATFTLYRTRGDQIQQYGYAAFGLTVAPYAFMSIMNIIGTLLNAEYPAISLVRTPIMDEAEEEPESDFFATEVCFRSLEGPCSEEYIDVIEGFKLFLDEDFMRGSREITLGVVQSVLLMLGGTLLAFVPLAIVGGLSKFQARESTSLQRGFTMSWLILSITYGPSIHAMTIISRYNPYRQSHIGISIQGMLNFFICFGVAPVGGMVMVGLMIREFGICTLLD